MTGNHGATNPTRATRVVLLFIMENRFRYYYFHIYIYVRQEFDVDVPRNGFSSATSGESRADLSRVSYGLINCGTHNTVYF